MVIEFRNYDEERSAKLESRVIELLPQKSRVAVVDSTQGSDPEVRQKLTINIGSPLNRVGNVNF
jgi:hypothetical protein